MREDGKILNHLKNQHKVGQNVFKCFQIHDFYAFMMKTEQMLNQVCDEDIAAANKAKNKKYVFTKCR